MRFYLFALVTLLFFSTCNQPDSCECVGSHVSVFFQTDNGDCTPITFDNLTITEYEPNFTLRDEDARFDIIDDCHIFLNLDEPGIWILESQAIGFNDTLRINSLEFEESGVLDCDCEPIIIDTGAELNGEATTGTVFFILY